MATPMKSSHFADALRSEGLTVVEVGNWASHHRNRMGPWGPVHGVMIHHTVTRGTASTVRICRDGYAGLPGPLCHGVIAKDGSVHLVGYGRANHAGLGDADVLQAVIGEQTLPMDDQADTDGNARFYGFECENLGDGKDPWPDAQLLAIERVSAAICRHHGWSARSVIGHQEWQPGKVDPRGVAMSTMRGRIGARLGSSATVPAPPAPVRPVVDLSRLTAAARTDPGRSGTPITYAGTRVLEVALVDAGLLAKRRLDGHYGADTVAAYAAWQRSKAGGSYTGRDADGIPGRTSLTRLGTRAGFTVTT